jgi:hypothetical protein
MGIKNQANIASFNPPACGRARQAPFALTWQQNWNKRLRMEWEEL